MNEMYERGFEHGREQAVLCCFGGSRQSVPEFNTPEEQHAYWDGYDAGYASLED